MKMKAGMIHHFHIQIQAYKRPPESVIFYPWGTNCIGKKNSQQLINRGYNKDHVESQLTKRLTILPREKLLKYQTKGKTDSVPLVLTFPDVLPNVNEILNKTT
jgi:hypothetical protein